MCRTIKLGFAVGAPDPGVCRLHRQVPINAPFHLVREPVAGPVVMVSHRMCARQYTVAEGAYLLPIPRGTLMVVLPNTSSISVLGRNKNRSGRVVDGTGLQVSKSSFGCDATGTCLSRISSLYLLAKVRMTRWSCAVVIIMRHHVCLCVRVCARQQQHCARQHHMGS